MKYIYQTTGVCSKQITLELDGDVIVDVDFLNGCPGNLEGMKRLVIGQKVNDVIARLEGIRCGKRRTSCPDQLAQALKQAQMEQKND